MKDVIKVANEIFTQRNRNARQGFGKSPVNSYHHQHKKETATFRSIQKGNYFERESMREPKLISEYGGTNSRPKPPEIAQTHPSQFISQISEQFASKN